MLSGYCLPAEQQDEMQLRFESLVESGNFAYAPLKSRTTAPSCALCPATITASRAARDMPLYETSAALLEPLTRAGLCTAWDATAACCQPRLGGRNGGDVPLLSAVVDAAEKAANIDASRIYVVGIANGGFMALRLACELGDRLAGVIAFASGLYANECTRPRSLPSMIIIQGDADVVVPYAGGKGSNGVPFPGHEETVSIFRGLLNCSGSATSSQFTAAPDRGRMETFPNQPLTVYEDAWRCAARKPGGPARSLEGWRIANGQHFANPEPSAQIFQRALHEIMSMAV